MTDAIGALMSALVAMAVLGEIGRYLAKERGINPWAGFAIGALLPLAGIGVLMLLKKTNAPRRTGG